MIKLDFSYPDFDTYEEYIKIDGNINFLDASKFERTLLRCSSCSETLAHEVMRKFYYLTKFDCGGKFLDDMVRTLVEDCKVPSSLYKSYKNKKGYSFDKNARDSIIDWLCNQYELTPNMYILMSFLKSICDKSALDSVLSSCRKSIQNGLIEPTTIPGWNGIKLMVMHNIYYQKTTGRYYAREMPIVGLPAPIRHCITAPKGHFLLSMDLRQIDLSVGYDMYLRGYSAEYDKVFDDEPEDKYVAMYKIICDYGKTPADIDYFKGHRAEVKTNILAGMYQGQLQTLNQTLLNTELNTNIVNYYEGNEGYQEQVRKIQALYELGIAFSIKDAFGYPMDIEIDEVKSYGSKTEGARRDFNKVARDCVSYITQSTSNSVKVKWLTELMKRLNAAGCTEDYVWACMDRHDEVAFTISIEAIKFMPVFKECEVVRISSWGDVRFKTEVSLHYGDDTFTWDNEEEILKDINAKIAESVKGYKPSYVPKEEKYTFKGIPNVHDVYVASVHLPVSLYSMLFDKEYQCMFDDADVQNECAKEIESCARQGVISPVFKSYASIWNRFIVRNTLSGKEIRVDDLNALPATLSKAGVEFVRVHTMYGDGFCSLGDCYGMKLSLSPEEVGAKLL